MGLNRWFGRRQSIRKLARCRIGPVKASVILERLEPRKLLSGMAFSFNLNTPASTSAGVYNSSGAPCARSGPGEVSAGRLSGKLGRLDGQRHDRAQRHLQR